MQSFILNKMTQTIYMAYSYKGSISFGLVYIPVTLHSAVKDNSIGFNMIDKKTMSRVKYKKTCADCDGREVKQGGHGKYFFGRNHLQPRPRGERAGE